MQVAYGACSEHDSRLPEANARLARSTNNAGNRLYQSLELSWDTVRHRNDKPSRKRHVFCESSVTPNPDLLHGLAIQDFVSSAPIAGTAADIDIGNAGLAFA